MIILDTHTWIWLINGDDKIRKSGFLSHINKSLKENKVLIPAICLWEVSMLVSKERIVLSESTLDWIQKASSAPGLGINPLSPEIAFESTVLPGEFHGDPADRIIVATTRILNGTLLTFDRGILDYSKRGYLQTIKPKR